MFNNIKQFTFKNTKPIYKINTNKQLFTNIINHNLRKYEK